VLNQLRTVPPPAVSDEPGIRSKYAGLEVDQVRQMAQLQEENLRLKKLVAELSLDKTMLQDVLSKKW
jgi:putative transposase